MGAPNTAGRDVLTTLPRSIYEQKTQNHTPAPPPSTHEAPQCREEKQRSAESQQTTPEWSEGSRSPRLTNGVRFEQCGCCAYQQVFVTTATSLIPERYVFGMVKVFTCRYHVENPPRKRK